MRGGFRIYVRAQGLSRTSLYDPCMKVKVLFLVGDGNSALMVSVALGISGISQAINRYMWLYWEYRRYFGRDVPLDHFEIRPASFFCLLGARSEGLNRKP